MRIGYSFWGFLGHGVTDTPDGGRSHRRILVDGLLDRGYEIVFLQSNRDLLEAGDDLTDTYDWDGGLPEIDALFLEWRWPIPGRNTIPCPGRGHTCDLHRQTDLVRHYILGRGLPALLWDKDQQLAADDPLRTQHGVTVCEPALFPQSGTRSLLFPVSDSAIDGADPISLAQAHRDLPLVYVGNQYDRDDAFGRLFAPAAARHEHVVAGKWPHTTAWPHVTFAGRRPFSEVERLHRRALATILLTPHRYAVHGQFTQRLFEAVLAGCLPIGPAEVRGAGQVLPTELIVNDGTEAADLIDRLRHIASTAQHIDLIAACLHRLDAFRLSRQLAVIDAVLRPCVSVRRKESSGDHPHQA
ncbi:hypothetical protein HDA32_005161 [Spinactinospora alkalitolerans]|uniref:Glycosyltransferase n=1 Tax=Spinactinospora alkalitolerans TaxID=687207 RepID=A0A852U1P2_9ACTN|nr:hypothetical protein [Spinactinospora alkalitolerans]NYE50041.1 hypothetical protein [Spinactinospora alkalitolerans]